MNCRRLVGAAGSLLIAGGCTQYARLSSGHVGCPESEIQTSDEVEGGGYGFPTTWKATCRGRVYYCTMTRGGWGYNQTSCTPASHSSSRDQGDSSGSNSGITDETPVPTGADPVVPTRTEAPGKAAGFDFGASVEQAAGVCTKAGGQWSAGTSQPSCSKPPLGVGFDGRVVLTLCDGRVCTIQVVRDAPDGEATRLKEVFVKLAAALQAKYGKADQARITVPNICADRLASCLRAQQARVAAEWNWPSQHAVTLVLAPRAEGVSLKLEYRSPSRVGSTLDGL